MLQTNNLTTLAIYQTIQSMKKTKEKKMQQLELFPELTTIEPYIGVEFTDGEDVYVSAKGIYLIDSNQLDCQGCSFAYDSTSKMCNLAEETLSCVDNPIIWVKKG